MIEQLIELEAANRYQPWVDPGLDPEFVRMKDAVQEHTVLCIYRLYTAYQFLKHALRMVHGNVADIGVYKGGSVRLFGEMATKAGRKTYGFDTFTGEPETAPWIDIHKEGDFSDVNFEDVQKFVKNFDVELFKGVFPETGDVIKDDRFCFVHIDVDLYLSCQDCLEFFCPRMSDGAIILLDDYGTKSCPGIKLATDEFVFDKDKSLIFLPTGQAVIIC